VLAALLMGVGLTAISASASTTLTFTPSADTHVRADRPKVNFGASTKLQVDNSPVFHTLLKFTVSGIGTEAVERHASSARGEQFHRGGILLPNGEHLVDRVDRQLG
jgi:acid phosphatase type 7